MRYLAIDTSGPTRIIALGSGTGSPTICRASRPDDGRPGHIEELAPAIVTALQEARWAPDSLDGIIVSAGPGSFTGLRISWATAKGVALAGDIPIIPVPTLEAIAGGAVLAKPYPLGTRVIVLTDARKDRWYTGIFSLIGSSEIRQVGTDRDIPLATLAQELETGADATPYPTVVCISSLTNGDALLGMVKERNPSLPIVAGEIDPELTGAGLLKLGARQHKNGGLAHDYAGPTYLRSGDIGKARGGPTFTPNRAGE